jgi:hypothetical protein
VLAAFVAAAVALLSRSAGISVCSRTSGDAAHPLLIDCIVDGEGGDTGLEGRVQGVVKGVTSITKWGNYACI